MKAIAVDIGKDHRQSLENRIIYGNEYSLRKRLKGLVGTYENNLKGFIKYKNQFVANAIDTRNYLTHSNPELKERACTEKELTIMTYQLKLMLEICILRSLGFEENEINTLISKHERYQYDYIKNRFVISII